MPGVKCSPCRLSRVLLMTSAQPRGPMGSHCTPARSPPRTSVTNSNACDAASRALWSASSDGHIHYRLKTPYRDGTTQVVFEPLDFPSRLAALVPNPRVILSRYHGAINMDWRPQPSSARASDPDPRWSPTSHGPGRPTGKAPRGEALGAACEARSQDCYSDLQNRWRNDEGDCRYQRPGGDQAHLGAPRQPPRHWATPRAPPQLALRSQME